MTEPVRIPLAEVVEQRLPSTPTKDGLASNIFYDKSLNGTIYAVKRPGITSYISASGLAQGTYTYGSNNFTFTGTQLTGFHGLGAFGNGYHFYLQDDTNTPVNKGIYSTNGISWIEVTLPAIKVWNICRFINGYFYILPQELSRSAGVSSSIYRSSDLINWTTITLADTCDWTDIAYGGGNYILSGIGGLGFTDSTLYRSTDGTSFSTVGATPLANFTGLSWNGTNFTAVSNFTTNVYTSPTGVTWTSRSYSGGLTYIRSSSDASGNIIVYNTSSYIRSTDSGVTWGSNTAFPSSTAYTFVEYMNNGFYGTSSGGNVIYSSDGTTFGSIGTISGSVAAWTSMTYGNSSYVSGAITGTNPPSLNYMARSTDAITWTADVPVNQTITVTAI